MRFPWILKKKKIQEYIKTHQTNAHVVCVVKPAFHVNKNAPTRCVFTLPTFPILSLFLLHFISLFPLSPFLLLHFLSFFIFLRFSLFSSTFLFFFYSIFLLHFTCVDLRWKGQFLEWKDRAPVVQNLEIRSFLFKNL